MKKDRDKGGRSRALRVPVGVPAGERKEGSRNDGKKSRFRGGAGSRHARPGRSDNHATGAEKAGDARGETARRGMPYQDRFQARLCRSVREKEGRTLVRENACSVSLLARLPDGRSPRGGVRGGPEGRRHVGKSLTKETSFIRPAPCPPKNKNLKRELRAPGTGKRPAARNLRGNKNRLEGDLQNGNTIERGRGPLSAGA